MVVTNWRDIFGNIELHGSIAEVIKENVSTYIFLIYSEGKITQSDLESFSDYLEAVNDSDISEVRKLLFVKFNGTSSTSPLPIIKLFTRSTDQTRYLEFEAIVRQLIIFRNHWSHQVSHEETGWGLLLSGLILRLIEVNISEKVARSSIDALRSAAYKLMKEVLANDPHGDEHGNYKQTKTGNQEFPDWALDLRNEFSNLTAQINQQRMDLKQLNRIGSKVQKLETEEDNGEQVIGTAQDGITFEVASQKLLKIKNKIQYENEEKIDWPGPTSNILNSSVIEDIRVLKPKDKEAFVNLPQILEIYQSSPKYFELQINDWWEQIKEVLAEIRWTNE